LLPFDDDLFFLAFGDSFPFGDTFLLLVVPLDGALGLMIICCCCV